MTINDRLTQLWSLLVESAHAQRVLTYDLLGQMIGVPEQAIGCFLRPIQDYCNHYNLPPLTSLALNEQEELLEAKGTADLFGERSRVFFFDWFSRKSPTPEDLLKVTTRGINEMTYYTRWQSVLNLR